MLLFIHNISDSKFKKCKNLYAWLFRPNHKLYPKHRNSIHLSWIENEAMGWSYMWIGLEMLPCLAK